MTDLRKAAQQALEAYDKTAMNSFVQNLYDEKMQEGKHGHYETMFHVVHEAVKRFAPPQKQAKMRMPRVGDKVICLEDESLGEVVSLTAGGSPDITFDDGTRGTYLLREFAELFGYAEQRQQQAEPMTEVADRFAHRMALELECVLSDGAYSNKWYKSAMQVLSEYRSAMNAIHEQHSPTFMGEPKV